MSLDGSFHLCIRNQGSLCLGGNVDLEDARVADKESSLGVTISCQPPSCRSHQKPMVAEPIEQAERLPLVIATHPAHATCLMHAGATFGTHRGARRSPAAFRGTAPGFEDSANFLCSGSKEKASKLGWELEGLSCREAEPALSDPFLTCIFCR